jgi:hypothetical protein
VLAIAALAYVVSFEDIRAFAIETAAFPAELAWSAPLLVDSFTTAASLVILWRYWRGDAWSEPWYAWTLVGCATAVSVALNVAHAPDRTSAQLFAALPPVALLGALELLMSVPAPACRTTTAPPPRRTAAATAAKLRPTAASRSSRPRTVTSQPGCSCPAPDSSAAAGNGSRPPRDSRARVRELVAHERATGTRLHAREIAAAVGISQRRAYELLRAIRAEG